MTAINIERFQKDVHKALRAWHQTSGQKDDFLDYLLSVKERREKSELRLPSRRLATNTVLLRGIQILNERDREGARVLTSRFLDQLSSRQVANQLNLSVDHVNRLQRTAIIQLSAILLEEEQAVRRAWVAEQESRLPPRTYTYLVGADERIDLIKNELTSAKTKNNIVVISGIGGIGKTALAQEVTHQLVQEIAFESFIWLHIDSARLDKSHVTAEALVERITEKLVSELLPEKEMMHDHAERLLHVQQALNNKPNLIVLDNFEDNTDISLLLAYLAEWGGVSKFLITARTRIFNPVGTFQITLTELGREQSIDLIRQQAISGQLPELAGATEKQIHEIYDVVGGNPLAIKLVVSLAHIMPLPHILKALTEQSTGAINDMYRRIYFQAWRALSDNAKNIMQAMPLLSENGGTFEHLLHLSNLEEDLFWAALNELVSSSLVEVGGTAYDRRYSYHRLTRNFLQRDILSWRSNE